MIEVEKKFILSDNDIERLVDGAEFTGERTFTDTYFDTPNYSLTTKDWWFRSREGKFELKVPLKQPATGERIADQYDELEDEPSIKQALGWPAAEALADLLPKNGYAPFLICTTTRRKYKKQEFVIDLDTVTFSDVDFVYQIGEIELMVLTLAETQAAAEKIIAFAKEQNLTLVPVRGKGVEYLKRFRPDHYQALVSHGVLKEF